MALSIPFLGAVILSFAFSTHPGPQSWNTQCRHILADRNSADNCKLFSLPASVSGPTLLLRWANALLMHLPTIAQPLLPLHHYQRHPLLLPMKLQPLKIRPETHHVPNGRAFGKGVRFMLESDKEHRIIQILYRTPISRPEPLRFRTFIQQNAVKKLPLESYYQKKVFYVRRFVPKYAHAIRARQGSLFHA